MRNLPKTSSRGARAVFARHAKVARLPILGQRPRMGYAKTSSRGARALILLALAATPAAWAMTAGEFAPPQPPAGLLHHRAPVSATTVRTKKPRPALVQDGSSFVFAPAGLQASKVARGKVASNRAMPTAPARGKAPAPKPVGVRRALSTIVGRTAYRPPAKVQITHPAFAMMQADHKSRRQKHAARPPLPSGARLVSTRDYNLFTFPSPLRKAILPPDAPVAGKPIYLNGGRVLMLRFYPDGRQPVQLVAEMQSGLIATLSLVPDSHKSGAHITISAPVPATAPLHEYSTNPNARYVRELSKLMSSPMTCPKRLHAWDSVRHDGRRVPVCWAYPLPGFTNKPLPPERIYNRLIARPVVSTGDGETGITAYILHARDHKRSVVDPGQFSWVGVHAALLTGDLVDRYHSPVLYIVTSENH